MKETRIVAAARDSSVSLRVKLENVNGRNRKPIEVSEKAIYENSGYNSYADHLLFERA